MKNCRAFFAAFPLTAAIAVGAVTFSPTDVAAAPDPMPQAIIKLELLSGASLADITTEYRLVTVHDVLSSHGIYLVAATPASGKAAKSINDLVAVLAKDRRLQYVEPNYDIDASDDRFHAWPEGDPDFVGTDPAQWLNQPVVGQLGLSEAHTLSTGKGAVVAVLDTGIDRNHPALRDRLDPAWDYVDDDNDPADARDSIDDDGDGAVDEAFGHGTHVAGIVALVAPDARILPARVLDADGRGNVFAVAAAIQDAVDDGATVINMSFGTGDHQESKLLKDAVSSAQHAGVVVVASAGNNGNDEPRFPASLKGVIGVAGSNSSTTGLAHFSNRGKWVTETAPSIRIVSAVPGGGYAAWSGTSMAAPVVSGQAALLDSLLPKSSVKKVREAIHGSSRKLSRGAKGDPSAVDIVASLRKLK